MLPAIMVVQAQVDLNKRPPLRAFWPADQLHTRFLRRAVCLLSVTSDAGTNDVLPSGRAASVARNHVIQIEVFTIERMAAVLAGVLVPFENIVSCEFDFLLRQPVEHDKQDYAWDANTE